MIFYNTSTIILSTLIQSTISNNYNTIRNNTIHYNNFHYTVVLFIQLLSIIIKTIRILSTISIIRLGRKCYMILGTFPLNLLKETIPDISFFIETYSANIFELSCITLLLMHYFL